MTHVYTLADPREVDPIKRVRYIGKAANPRKRLAVHMSRARKTRQRTHCYAWIRSLLALGMHPVMELMSSYPSDIDALQAECAAIAMFRERGALLTNLTDGGEGAAGRPLSAENIARLRAINQGNKHWLGRHHTAETRAKLAACKTGNRNPQFGRTHTAETRAKMSASHKGLKGYWKGRRFSEGARRKTSAAQFARNAKKEVDGCS